MREFLLTEFYFIQNETYFKAASLAHQSDPKMTGDDHICTEGESERRAATLHLKSFSWKIIGEVT